MGFFEGRDLGEGLAGTLASECQKLGISIVLHSSLGACLSSLREVVPLFDKAGLLDNIGAWLQPALSEVLKSKASSSAYGAFAIAGG